MSDFGDRLVLITCACGYVFIVAGLIGGWL